MSPSGETEVLETQKRVMRKRTPRAVVDAGLKAPIKRVSRAQVKKSDGAGAALSKVRLVNKTKDREQETSSRKAPTPLAGTKLEKKSSRKHLIVIGVLLVIGIGSSALVGLTDKGQIDVVTMIEERNKKAEERGEKVISTSVKDQLPDGGLVPADPSTIAPSTPPPTASTTASTTSAGSIPRTAEEVAAEAQTTATST
ncbi:MAG: hypothetical protein AAB618_03245 [Patescibacteria group bacterium]